MSELSERIAALSPAKRALLARRTQGNDSEPASDGLRRLNQTTAPLSFAQERLWFLDRLEPESNAFTLPSRLRFAGELDISALHRCLNEIVRRHEIVRTRYEMVDGSPVQVIEPFTAIEFPLIDLTELAEPLREAEAERLCSEMAGNRFDLTRDLMLRACLIRMSRTDHILFLNRHHIASDGWSLGILKKELETLYSAFIGGGPSPLAELAAQYSDYAVWQRNRLQGAVMEKEIAYWRDQLRGAPFLLELPTDRPRGLAQTSRGALLPIEIPERLACALAELSRREGVTLFMTLMSAFQALLVRYTGHDQMLVGTVLAGRNRTELENLMGFFVNTVVFRGDLSGNPSFRSLLRRTREVSMAAYAHQELPFELLVKEFRPQRDLSRSPIVQVMFVLQNGALDLKLPGIPVTPFVRMDNGNAEMDLIFSIEEYGGLLKGHVQYSMDLFDEETIRRMIGHFETLLTGITANPDQQLSTLPILSPAERRRMLEEWNSNQNSHPVDQCVQELFEAQAERTPDAVAVVCGAEKLTYRELNSRSNKLARFLATRGVGPNVLVALCLDRSPMMLVGIFGILKAGGGYLPLDPSYPQERLEFMLNDSKASLLLTMKKFLQGLPSSSIPVVPLDEYENESRRQDERNPVSQAAAENLAYVIYTSGSTGLPKGVPVRHRNLTHSMAARFAYYEEPVTAYLLLSSYAFDSSVAGIFWTLLTGGSLILPPEDEGRDLSRLAALIHKHRISHLLCLPSLYAVILEQSRPNELGSLRAAIVAGEACPASLISRHHDLLPGTSIFNEYGPTEGTVWSTVHRCDPVSGRTQVPIGRPVQNVSIYILDSALEPVPVGVPGEMYIGGDGVVEGYLDRPVLTAEKFITDPFKSSSDRRLYKTGDLARYLPDGNIEFLGRIDHQVKIRGYRIELEEVENVLRQQTGVQDVSVIAREDTPGEKRLVSYVVSKEGVPFNENDLRTALKRKLPDYMVPSSFVSLPALPLTPNGKVDRAALPEPNVMGRSDEPVEPQDELEKRLVTIWEKHLGRHPIGIRDNFFDIGGHSLLAVSVFAEIEKKLGKNLPLATLFQAPTIEQLAGALRERGWLASWTPLVRMKPEGAKPPLFFVHGADGGVLHYRPLIALLDADQPCYGLQSPGLDGASISASTAGEFARLYIEAIREVQPKGPYLLSGFSSGGVIAFEMAQQLRANDEEVALLIVFDTGNPMTPARRYTFAERVALRRQEIANLSLFQSFRYLLGRFFGMIYARTLQKTEQLQKLFYHREKKRGSQISYEYRHLHVREVNRKIYLDYKPGPYEGRITIFRADSMEKGFAYDEYLGWKGIARGGIELRIFSALHGELFKQPCVEGVATEITRCVRSALG